MSDFVFVMHSISSFVYSESGNTKGNVKTYHLDMSLQPVICLLSQRPGGLSGSDDTADVNQ